MKNRQQRAIRKLFVVMKEFKKESISTYNTRVEITNEKYLFSKLHAILTITWTLQINRIRNSDV